jgi:AraC-like DNA-binding protein
MRHSEVLRGSSLHIFRPPYDEHETWAVQALLERRGGFPRGTLILVRPLPGEQWDCVARVVIAVTHRFTREALCLWTDLLSASRAIGLAQHARLLGVRAAVHRAILDPELIRQQLTEQYGFGRDVAAWCQRAGVPANGVVSDTLSCLASEAIGHATLQDLATSAGVRDGTWRTAFRRANLAPPAKWFQAFRIVSIANVIQREHDTPIRDIAARFGFYDPAAVGRRLRETIGASVRDVRRLLGWEWMLADAVRRYGLLRFSVMSGGAVVPLSRPAATRLGPTASRQIGRRGDLQ